VISHAGADALRFSLVSLVTAGGQDLKLAEEKITEGRNFANKIWNVSRFVFMQEGNLLKTDFDEKSLSMADRWILSRFNLTASQITDLLDNFEFGESARRLYEFIWSEFCDWYVELSKISLYGGHNKDNTLKVLNFVLSGTLKILHPFMPFETEEIFSKLDTKERTIMLSKWPVSRKDLEDRASEEKMALIINAIRAVRNIRAEMNVPSGKEIEIVICAEQYGDVLKEGEQYIRALVKAKEVKIVSSSSQRPPQSAMAVVPGAEIYVPLGGLIDIDKELLRLEKTLADTESFISRIKAKLDNPDFVNRAKPELVEAEKTKLQDMEGKKAVLEDSIKSLKR